MIYTDRRIVLTLLLAGCCLFGLLFVPGDNTRSADRPPREEAREPVRPQYPRQKRSPYYRTEGRRAETFDFDPNTADSTQLLRLGLRPWQVRSIYKYRARGGIYQSKEDFANLYGLTVKDYRRLEPYIRISPDFLPATTLRGRRGSARDTVQQPRDTVAWPQKLEEGQHVVLNTASKATLRKVPGIGHYFAGEILRHGEWLGGYVSVDQLDEISDFPTETKKYFIVRGATPKKLNLNKLTLDGLRRHPYINFYQAKAILDYRRMYGRLENIQELGLLPAFSERDLKRLAPYVEF